MKRKRNYVKASPELMDLMNRKRNHVKVCEQPSDLYLPDECWEFIFKFITKTDDFKSLSAVSKQLLSITNRLQFSLTLRLSSLPFISALFQRFTNLTSLNLSCTDIDILLPLISPFPVNITSLHLSQQLNFPARGLTSFSRHIKTLTSLTCSNARYFDYNYQFFLIAHCFQALQILDLSDTTCITVSPNLRLQRKFEAAAKFSSEFPHLDVFNLSIQFPKLETLNLSFTAVDDEQLCIVSKACHGLLQLLLKGCMYVTENGVKHVLENCTQLTEIDIGWCFNVNPTVVASMLFSRPSLRRITVPPDCNFSNDEKKVLALRGCIVSIVP